MARQGSIGDWLHHRTGYRALIHSFRDDPTPRRVAWAYTLGSALLLLLLVQLATGVTMMLYYVPTPTHAYDSVRYIVSTVPYGALVRGLHYYGASFIVAIALLHLLRTLLYGAYKAPREVTWLSGFVLLVLIIAFGITGYLLPWDQAGYWATAVRANIAGTAPVIGPWLSRLMKGGPAVGALTLSRWYAVHVAVLPALAALVTVGHLLLVRRHGRAGHFAPAANRAPAWLPHQGVRNMFVAGGVFGVLVAVASVIRAPLESMADPADFTFIPHPEWYFLWLFQLMKLTQGPLEQVGAPVVLTIVMAFLVLLPFADSSMERHPARRRWVMASATLGLLGVSTLTWISLRALPPDKDPDAWSPVAIAGHAIVGRTTCAKCHGADKAAPDLMRGRVAHDNAWIRNHLLDPETIVPGARPVPFDAPTRPETGAVIAYVRMVRGGARPPRDGVVDREVALAYTTACASCHTMDGDGINDGPDLSHAGRKHDAAWIARKIVDPAATEPQTKMPSLRDKMSASQVQAMAAFLAARK